MNRSEQGIFYEQVSRRALLRKGSQVLVAATLGKGLVDLNAPAVAAEKLVAAQFLYRRELDAAKSVTRKALYNSEAEGDGKQHNLPQTRFLTLGDSIARGFYGVKDAYHPSVEIVMDRINAAWPDAQWKNTMYAREWDTIDDVRNTQWPEAKKVLADNPRVDINLCVGGNDVVAQFLQNSQTVKELEVFRKNSHTPNRAWLLVPQFALAEIDIFQQNFTKLLRDFRIEDEKGHLNRIFVQGLPDLGKTDVLDYNSPTGQITIPVTGWNKVFASNLSLLMNVAMKRAVEAVSGENILLNNFAVLEKGEITNVHPTPIGQDTMAAYQLNRMMYKSNTSIKPLYIAGKDPRSV